MLINSLVSESRFCAQPDMKTLLFNPNAKLASLTFSLSSDDMNIPDLSELYRGQGEGKKQKITPQIGDHFKVVTYQGSSAKATGLIVTARGQNKRKPGKLIPLKGDLKLKVLAALLDNLKMDALAKGPKAKLQQVVKLLKASMQSHALQNSPGHSS